jgi:hypothetical protein
VVFEDRHLLAGDGCNGYFEEVWDVGLQAYVDIDGDQLEED